MARTDQRIFGKCSNQETLCLKNTPKTLHRRTKIPPKSTLGTHLSRPETQSKQRTAPKAKVLARHPHAETKKGSKMSSKFIKNRCQIQTCLAHHFRKHFGCISGTKNLSKTAPETSENHLRRDELLHHLSFGKSIPIMNSSLFMHNIEIVDFCCYLQ